MRCLLVCLVLVLACEVVSVSGESPLSDYVFEQRRANDLLDRTAALLNNVSPSAPQQAPGKPPRPPQHISQPTGQSDNTNSALSTDSNPSANSASADDSTPPITPPSGPPADKLALIVGINNYKVVNKLSGCVNDAQNIEQVLITNYDFPKANIMMLVDHEATHHAIVQAFRRHLIQRATKDAIVVFHYSGHGSRMKDPETNPVLRTPSGKLTTIVPVDSRSKDIFDISSNELRGLLAELSTKTKNVTFILDSCHSGIGLKEAAALKRVVEDDPRDPPAISTAAGGQRNIEGFAGRDYALISACRTDEVAFEYEENGQPCGTLTHFLAAELLAAGKGKVTYRDIMDKVKSSTTGAYRLQHPQLEGANMDNVVFSMEKLVARPFVLVSPKNKGVLLSAGRVHGVTVGSVYDIFPPGSKAFDESERVVAQMEVTSVDFSQSTGKLLRPATVVESSRAVERQHRFGDQKVRVYFDTTDGNVVLGKIRSVLKGKQLTVNDNEKSPSFSQAFEESMSPTGARVILHETKTSIAVLDAGRHEMSPPVSVADPEAVAKVLEQLVMWAKWYAVLDLSNSQPELKVDFTIEAAADNRDPDLAAHPDLTLRDGDELKFTVTNHGRQDIYFAILDLSSTGRIGVVYPGEGRNEALAPGQVHSEKVPVSVPEGQKMVRDYLKLIVTQTDVDFRPLQQEGIKDVPGEDDPLMQLIGEALLVRSREVGQSIKRLDGWSTNTQILEVMAKE